MGLRILDSLSFVAEEGGDMKEVLGIATFIVNLEASEEEVGGQN